MRNGTMGCMVSGNGPKAKGTVIEADPDTNVLYCNGSIPSVAYRIGKQKKVTVETIVRTFVG